jgi:hypothetical protein
MKIRSCVFSLAISLPTLAAAQIGGSGPGIFAGGGVSSSESNPLAPVLWDEFMTGAASTGVVGSLGWTPSGTTCALNGSLADHPGIARCTNAASATGGLISNTQGDNLMISNLESLAYLVYFETGANVPTARIGIFTSAVGTSPPNSTSVYFEHVSGDTNWFAVTRDAGGATRTDTGVAFAAAAWIRLGIAHPASGRFDFYVNGNLTNSRTAGNIPIEAAGVYTYIQFQTTGTAAAFWVDYFWMRMAVSR